MLGVGTCEDMKRHITGLVLTDLQEGKLAATFVDNIVNAQSSA